MGAEYKAKFLKNSQRHDKKTFFLKTFKNNFKKWLTKPKMSGKIHHVPNGTYALVAQLDRVTDYESVGRGFESLPSHQEKPEHIGVLVFLFVCTMEGLEQGGGAQRRKQSAQWAVA